MFTRSFVIYAVFTLFIGLATTTALMRSMNHKQYDLLGSYMDANANPCTDFYQYACGNWKSIHGNQSYTDTLERVDHEIINEEFEQILKVNKQSPTKQHRFVRQAIAFYKSCISLLEYLPLKYLKKLEAYEDLTWPDFEHNNRRSRHYSQFRTKLRKYKNEREEGKTNSYYWIELWATLRKYGLNGPFISENVLPKRKNSSQYIIEVDQPELYEEFEELQRSEFVVIMEEIGIKKAHKMEHLWQTFNGFEKKYLELYDIEDTIGYEEISLVELETKLPQLNQYLSILLNVTENDGEMRIGIANRPYMHALFNLLSNYDDEFICRYLTLRFLWHLHYDGPTDLSSKSCVVNLREKLTLTMAWLHEQHHPELLAETENIERMFDNLRSHFAEILNTNPNNFDDEVLQFLNMKLKHMQLKVGNLPRNATVTTMDSFYRELALNENDFYGNHLKILRFLAKREHALLQNTLPQDSHNFYYLEDAGFGSTTTPYYLPRRNIVIFPLTMLHLPLYHAELHDVFKYSLVGFLLAHEITHGFDESGLDYDEKGNMRKEFGELIKANTIFDGHLECLLAKNPNIIDEKIADVSGLRWAYETYFGKITQATQQLQWSKISQPQLFFRNFALFFCGDISAEDQLVNSTHGTYRSRLYDAISQFDEFGRTFNCRGGTSMNPRRRCQLWR